MSRLACLPLVVLGVARGAALAQSPAEDGPSPAPAAALLPLRDLLADRKVSGGGSEPPPAPRAPGLLGQGLRLNLAAPRPVAEPDEGLDVESAAGSRPPIGMAELAKRLRNPIADLISVPLQFNYDKGLGPKDAARFTLNIQPVIPFSISDDWNLISRTILPVVYQQSLAEGLSSDFGLGDSLQSFFFSPKETKGEWDWGAGPAFLRATGTTPRLRSESFGLGPTAIAVRQDGGWTYGILANHIWSITQSDDHEEVNATFLQPFISYTWPSATSLSLNTESTYNWKSSDWTVPLNLQLGQVFMFGDTPVQFQVGGRYYAASPQNGPEWGLRFTITFAFP